MVRDGRRRSRPGRGARAALADHSPLNSPSAHPHSAQSRLSYSPTNSSRQMSHPDEVDPEPTSAPYSLEAAEEPGQGDPHSHNSTHHPNPPEEGAEPEAGLEDQFQSVALDQDEPHLNTVKSPKLQQSFGPPASDTPSHRPSSDAIPSQSASTSTDHSLAATTQPSSTQSVDQDAAHTKDETEAAAKADAQPEPVPAAATTPPAPTPQPKPSTSAPTTMQKVVSLTRQRDLPPKSKEEEVS